MRPGPRSRPVFVDQSGRRRRLAVLIGSALGGLLIAILGLLLAGLSGAVGVPLPGFPDAGRQADTSPSPEPQGGLPAPQPAPPAPEQTAAASPREPQLTRRVPTQTPSHPPRPSKT